MFKLDGDHIVFSASGYRISVHRNYAKLDEWLNGCLRTLGKLYPTGMQRSILEAEDRRFAQELDKEIASLKEALKEQKGK